MSPYEAQELAIEASYRLNSASSRDAVTDWLNDQTWFPVSWELYRASDLDVAVER